MAEANGVTGINGVNGHNGTATSAGSNAAATIDFLIVGTGPAGSALACFLAQNGTAMPAYFHVSTQLLKQIA